MSASRTEGLYPGGGSASRVSASRGGLHPEENLHPGGGLDLGRGVCIREGVCNQGEVCIQGVLHPGGVGQTPQALQDTVNKQAVHILLECILVLECFLVFRYLYAVPDVQHRIRHAVRSNSREPVPLHGRNPAVPILQAQTHPNNGATRTCGHTQAVARRY